MFEVTFPQLNSFSFSLFFCLYSTKQDVQRLSALLDRSQLEARALLEKKESLLQQIHHMTVERSDQETILNDVKKKLWQTGNALNKVQGAYEALQRTSQATQQKLMQDIQDLNHE